MSKAKETIKETTILTYTCVCTEYHFSFARNNKKKQ